MVVFDLGFATSATDPGVPASVRWSVRIERHPPATEVPRQRLVEASLASDSAMDRGIGKRCRSCSGHPAEHDGSPYFWTPNEFEKRPASAGSEVCRRYGCIDLPAHICRRILVDASRWSSEGARRATAPLPAPARRCPDSRFAFRQASNLSARNLAESEAGALAKRANRTTTIPQVMPATEAIEARKTNV